MDSAKVSAEMKTYHPIPAIVELTDEEGKDILKETIEENYKRVKRDVLNLVGKETERIKSDPSLSYLIKKES